MRRVAEDLLIRTEGLTKRYGAVTAVEDVALSVRRGEVYGFLGRNGAGKTTTMRMLLGLIRPTSGTATVMGHPPGDPQSLAGLGAIVEAPAFYPYLSGRENLEVLARYAGADRAVIDDALAQVGLVERAGDKVKGYSMGMRQRLGVAAALLKRPSLLILDEPTNGLDPQGMATMRAFIRSLGQGDRTVMLSSHLLGEVEQVCDRVGVIEQGRLIAEGSVAELRGRSSILVRAEPLDQAAREVAALVGEDAVRTETGLLRVTAEAEQAAAINRRLVEAGVEVSELRPVSRSLEEVFIDLTGEEGGAA